MIAPAPLPDGPRTPPDPHDATAVDTVRVVAGTRPSAATGPAYPTHPGGLPPDPANGRTAAPGSSSEQRHPLPRPRRPLATAHVPDSALREWYRARLGWATVAGPPVRLVVGERFDVLEVPLDAGRAALARVAPGVPVAAGRGRLRLLVAAGSAEELPGILDWLEWGPLPLDLTAVGAGGLMEAPPPPGPCGRAVPRAAQGAAVWMRPPGVGCEAGTPLPTLSALGSAGHAPDLVRLVDTLATHCHRARLRRRARTQPLASS